LLFCEVNPTYIGPCRSFTKDLPEDGLQVLKHVGGATCTEEYIWPP